GPGAARGVVGKRVEGEKARSDNLAIGLGHTELTELAHHVDRDVVAPGDAPVEEDAVEVRPAVEHNIALLVQFTLKRLDGGFADLDAATRQVPARDVRVLDQKYP